ncbi:hypothetical protein [Bradyrhizobium yuanmingense]|nr:hypothetical protein [Bradyrhizobium yuanmingense]
MGAHLLFVMPYGPDLNLLKQLFANLKLRVPADRDHPFQAIVITHSRAS